MIVGIGTDLIEVKRVAKAYEREAFRRKVYTEQEQKLIGTRMQTAAGNFAVKEAVAKAFGTGFGAMETIEIETLREPSGKPYVILHGRAETMRQEKNIRAIHVSISNTNEYAIAYVVLEQ
ncbi:MAG: holo-ACP synthase [Lachnospiraceae bacterium]